METVLLIILVFVLWFLPIPLGIRKAKQKHRSPHWMWISIFPIYGWLVFIILCLIPPVKICPNCGERNKTYAAACQRCNFQFDQATITEYVPKTKKQKIIRVLIIICIVITLLFAFYLFINDTFKNSIPYKMAIETLKTNSQVQEIIGDSIRPSGFVSGSISTSGSSGDANLSFKMAGTHGSVKVYLIAVKEFEIWRITKLYLRENELIKIIDE